MSFRAEGEKSLEMIVPGVWGSTPHRAGPGSWRRTCQGWDRRGIVNRGVEGLYWRQRETPGRNREVFPDQASACPPDISPATTPLLQTRRLVEWAALSFSREGSVIGPQSKTHVQKNEILAFIEIGKGARVRGIRTTKT
jgi:hypothetical protein